MIEQLPGGELMFDEPLFCKGVADMLDGCGWNVLHYACKTLNLSAINLFVQSMPELANTLSYASDANGGVRTDIPGGTVKGQPGVEDFFKIKGPHRTPLLIMAEEEYGEDPQNYCELLRQIWAIMTPDMIAHRTETGDTFMHLLAKGDSKLVKFSSIELAEYEDSPLFAGPSPCCTDTDEAWTWVQDNLLNQVNQGKKTVANIIKSTDYFRASREKVDERLVYIGAVEAHFDERRRGGKKGYHTGQAPDWEDTSKARLDYMGPMRDPAPQNQMQFDEYIALNPRMRRSDLDIVYTHTKYKMSAKGYKVFEQPDDIRDIIFDNEWFQELEEEVQAEREDQGLLQLPIVDVVMKYIELYEPTGSPRGPQKPAPGPVRRGATQHRGVSPGHSFFNAAAASDRRERGGGGPPYPKAQRTGGGGGSTASSSTGPPPWQQGPNRLSAHSGAGVCGICQSTRHFAAQSPQNRYNWQG